MYIRMAYTYVFGQSYLTLNYLDHSAKWQKEKEKEKRCHQVQMYDNTCGKLDIYLDSMYSEDIQTKTRLAN